jgi:hypothetical protein
MEYWGALTHQLLRWKSNKYCVFWVCACSLGYPASKAHAPYYIVICSLSGYTTFFHISYKRHDFRKQVIEDKMFWFCLQRLPEIFFTLRRTERDITKNVHRSSCKVMLFLTDFNETWILLDRLRKMLNFQISRNFVQWEPSCSMRAYGQTQTRQNYRPLLKILRMRIKTTYKCSHLHRASWYYRVFYLFNLRTARLL